MKSRKQGVGIVAMAGLLGLTVFWAAAQVVSLGQSSKPQAVPLEKLPAYGTFLSLQRSNQPPLPMNPLSLPIELPRDLTAYVLAPGVYAVEDRGVDYKKLELLAQVKQLEADLAAVEAGEMTLQSLLEGKGGGGGMALLSYTPTNCGTGEPWTLMNPLATIQSNGLFTFECDLMGGFAGTNLHLFRVDSLREGGIANFSNVFWQGAYAACSHVILTNQPALGNSFYFGVDEFTDAEGGSGDGLPDWWEFRHFGSLSYGPADDPDQDGISNGDEYTNHTDPNSIQFHFAIPGPRVRTNGLMASLWVTNGVPSQLAVLYDATNTAGAAWGAWAGGTNWPVTLPGSQGRHTVWIGLRGRNADSQAAWQSDSVILDSVPPGMVVDAPTNTAASASVVTVKGHSPEALSKVQWSLDGTHFAPGFVTETALEAGGDFGASLFEFTAGLAAGTNTLTVRATDLAGNTSNVVKQIVYTIPTNGPSLSLAWTPGLTPVAGDSFLLSGEISDAGGTVEVSAEGMMPVMAGVEAGEPPVFFANDVPLLEGTNVYTVTVTDAQGRSVSTNVTVRKSAVALGVEWALTAGYAYRPNAHRTYDVTVGGADFSSVTINGTGAAWNAGRAQWQAPNVTMNTTGAVPGFVVNANVSGGGTVCAAFNPVIQPQVIFERFWVKEQTEILDYPDAGIHIVAHDCSWDRTNGGAIHSSWYQAEGGSVLADTRLGLLLDTNDIYVPGSGWVTNGTLSWYESFFFPNCFAIPHWDFADYTPTGPTGHGWGDMQGRIQRTLLPGGRRGHPNTTVLLEMSATESSFDEFGGYAITYPSQEFFSVLWPSNAAASRFKMSGEPMIVESSGSLTGRVVRTFPAFKPVSLPVEVADSKAYTVAVTVATVTLDIDGDASMDGLIDEADENGEELTPAGILVPLNTDDDDGDGQPDATDNVINGSTDHDFTDVILRQIHLPGQLTNGIGYWLKLEGDAVVRVFDTNTPGAVMLLGPGTNTEYRLPAAGSGVTVEQLMAHDIQLWIEGISTTGAVKLVFEICDTNGPLGGSGRDVLQLCVPEVRLPAVLGLFKPGTNGVGEFNAGYSSADNEGRIYINSRFTTNGSPVWVKDQQFVVPVVQVFPAGVKLPASARIHWDFEDPDDPSDDSTMTAAARLIIDPDGSAANDNRGSRLGFAWEAVTNYPMSGFSTPVRSNLSMVRFNATDIGGDNFIIKTRLAVPRWGDSAKGAETGIMTMWKRINLENVRLTNAPTLPLDDLNPAFAKSFVEWVPTTTTTLNTTQLPDPLMNERDGSLINSNVNYFIETHFTNKYQGGWFFAASGGYLMTNDYNPTGDPWIKNEAVTIVTVTNHVADGDLWGGEIRLSTSLSTNQHVDSVYLRKDTNSPWLSLQAKENVNDATRTRIRIYPHDYAPQVENPNSYEFKSLQDYGLTVTTQAVARVKAYAPGVWRFTGWSPSVPPGDSFQGRTMTFYANDLASLVHELTHGLGMAHKCGNPDITGAHLCLMLYPTYWIRNANGTLTYPESAADIGVALCATHIRAIRDAHLEDDSAGRHLGW